ncbi:MAG: ketoacyl-ACP synthase III [Lachnospiraceae bacterium]|nr:ketoacyl-ACP synthase III [Lachnospiraceae bacterium]
MKILGSGHYAPHSVITNDDLAKIVETNDEWITSRTGISTRHISDGEEASDLAAKAALIAIEDAGIDPADIDMILLATMSPDAMLPNCASTVQAKIGATNATCFDINAACSGFLFALNTANAYLVSGMYKNILVIGTETLSKVVDWSDRASCILFGDGAGAMIVTADDSKAFCAVTGSDGVKGPVLTGAATPLKNMLVDTTDDTSAGNYYLHMDGQEVFKFAVSKVPECIGQVLAKASVTVEDIDLFVLHQANVRIISAVAKRLGVDSDKIPVNLDKYGNTSAASIPILFDELKKSGALDGVKKIVLSGFGGGLTWGATYMEL